MLHDTLVVNVKHTLNFVVLWSSCIIKRSYVQGGEEFFDQLHIELAKVNAFFTAKEKELEEILSNLNSCDASGYNV